MRVLLVSLIAGALIASGAEIAGTWKASYTMPDGYKHESTFDLRSDGAKVTGKITQASVEPSPSETGP